VLETPRTAGNHIKRARRSNGTPSCVTGGAPGGKVESAAGLISLFYDQPCVSVSGLKYSIGPSETSDAASALKAERA
jgi:hypothetical protein